VLSVESRIVLPAVLGRIDHMAADVAGKRLFIAEIGNGSLDIVDLAIGRRVGRITGLAQPQGVGYARTADTVAIASGGDGSVRFYRGADLASAGAVMLGTDADDVRVDPATGDFVVGYGSGGLVVIDPKTRERVGDIRLAAHPEGFAIDRMMRQVYANVPQAGQIAVIDLTSIRQTATWGVPRLRANFPMAVDAAGTQIATVFRRPPTLVLIDTGTGLADCTARYRQRRRRRLL
jgi:DNA-binding beta-propeller fold protein YncE